MQPYYERGGITIYHGNCLELLAELPAVSVDALVTDPPYYLPAVHYNVRAGSFRSLSGLGMLEHFYRDAFTAARRILRDNGFAYVFCDGQSYPVFYAVAYRHFRAIRPLIWDKQVSINGYAWRHQHELILFGEAPSAPMVKTGDGDVLHCRAVPITERLHLAEKPVELLSRLIAKTSPADGLVLDPFCGSGSTGEAAALTGRRFIGIEDDESYCEIAARRLDQVASGRLVRRDGEQDTLPFDIPA